MLITLYINLTKIVKNLYVLITLIDKKKFNLFKIFNNLCLKKILSLNDSYNSILSEINK